MLYLKALHIIFVVTWFAGLFYIVRLFIYHTEAEEKNENEKNILQNQFKIMEKRLWYGITWPSMILTWGFGLSLVYQNYAYYLSAPWFILKFAFVLGLSLYHYQCHMIYKQLQRNEIKRTPLKLRIWNEVATLFLVSIVFIVILKNTLSFVWGLIGLILVSVAIYIAIQIYKKSRGK